IAASAVLCFICVSFLSEPKGHIAEVQEDGTVQLLKVA
ncbi:MAG: hypothetical protein RJA70_1845, partial [Pseudomonadota bacterium]